VLTSSMLLRPLYLSLAVPLIFFSGHLEAIDHRDFDSLHCSPTRGRSPALSLA
jgi:hypothetical protein